MDGKGQARKNREKSDQQKDALNKKNTKTGRFNRTDVNKRKINEEKTF